MKGDLKKAANLYNRAKFPQVIRLLEPQIFRYRQNFDYFYLLGMACVHTGDLGGASTYLQRALGIHPHESSATLGLAYVHLKRQEIQEAIRCYLEVLENDPGNKTANRGLTLLRKDASDERIQDLSESGRLNRLLPHKRKSLLPPFILVSGVIVIAAATVSVLWFTGKIGGQQAVREPAVEMLGLGGIGSIVDFSGNNRYILTEKEIEKAFLEVKKHFSEYNDNLARREINRLLGSNASGAVKEQARIIDSYIETPDFTTLRNPFEYNLVAADPFLYNETYVIWRGKLTNLNISSDRITFDLLVGYEENKVLLGVVPVILDFAAALETGDALEVLGRVKLTDNSDIFLEAVSIHKLQPGELNK